MTCDDIKNIDLEVISFAKVVERKRKILEEELSQINGALSLSAELLEAGVEYNSMPYVDSIELVQYIVSKQGKKIYKEEKKREPIHIDSNIAENVTIAHKMLPYIWGTEVSECNVTSDWQERLIDITLPITYETTEQMETVEYFCEYYCANLEQDNLEQKLITMLENDL